MSMTSRRTVALFALGLALAPTALAGDPKKEAKPKKGPDAQRKISGAETYVPLFGIATAVSQNLRPVGAITADVGLDVPDAALRRRAQQMEPRLRDGLRTALSDYASTFYRPGGVPDLDQIGRIMQAAVDRVLGGPGAKLLLANVMVQDARR
jgi:flagellar basal body-associated protein FliL